MDIFDLGEEVARFRKRKRLSQRQLAAQADVSLTWLSKFERGDSFEPSIHRVMRVLHKLDLDLHLGTYNHGRPTLDELSRKNEEIKEDMQAGREPRW
ncbi:helix-turn-helix transcriptional regulator [Methylobacterium sp. WL7]|uniref:helix-turn-helix domain-containing protein n=1 Tax=Methylobacterium sp. WL7 TaxID=2603900 RepID=UPI0011CBDA85|nr:helix-turn-helix transcriptional regulator [Methylobacterium sp. WL7]TXN47346.1 helix-turn-helix transcriptional regulator [Methylobacterium sp. WL7]